MSEATKFLEGLYKDTVKRLVPGPIDDWVSKNRVVTDDSAYPGLWKHERVMPSLDPLNAFTDPTVQLICVVAPVQMMKTEILINISLYSLYCGHQVILYEPDLFLAEEIFKTRLRPSIEAIPSLAQQLIRHRDYAPDGNTGKIKSYDTTTLIRLKSGASIKALSPSQKTGLSSRSPRVVLVDEVSRMGRLPLPELLGRLTSWKGRGKIVLVSSPGDKESCEITKLWEQGSRGLYHGKCPECSSFIPMIFENVTVPLDEKSSWNIKDAGFDCSSCGTRWSEIDRKRAIKAGKWIHEYPENEWRTFRTTGFASPFTSVSQILKEGHKAREKMRTIHDPTDYKIWTQERLAQPWDETVAGISVEFLKQLTYELPDDKSVKGIVSDDVLVITCGMDVGANYVCGEFVGWGVDKDGSVISWGLGYFTLNGAVTAKQVWVDLTELLESAVWKRKNGTVIRLTKALIDCSYQPSIVKDYCRQLAVHENEIMNTAGLPIEDQQYGWKVMPCRGDRAAISAFLVRTLGKVARPPNEVVVGGSKIKDWIFDAFSLSKQKRGDGPNPMNFPSNLAANGYDDAYFESLTNERKAQHKDRTGRLTMRWVKIIHGRPNEALDCRVYSMAALSMVCANGSVSPSVFLRKLKSRIDLQDSNE